MGWFISALLVLDFQMFRPGLHDGGGAIEIVRKVKRRTSGESV